MEQSLSGSYYTILCLNSNCYNRNYVFPYAAVPKEIIVPPILIPPPSVHVGVNYSQLSLHHTEVSICFTTQANNACILIFLILVFSYLKSNGTDDRGKRFRFSEELDRACQIEFGSYCLWSIERREFMKDAIVKRLKDQLFVARSYYPSIAKLQGKEALARELKQCIQEHEKVLSESIVDGDLPSSYVLMFIYLFNCSFWFTEIGINVIGILVSKWSDPLVSLVLLRKKLWHLISTTYWYNWCAKKVIGPQLRIAHFCLGQNCL